MRSDDQKNKNVNDDHGEDQTINQTMMSIEQVGVYFWKGCPDHDDDDDDAGDDGEKMMMMVTITMIIRDGCAYQNG